VRKNGGVPPPPQPIFPTEFAIQLYNPAQQIVVQEVKTKWSGSVSYEFSMPQNTFRTPSASSLDRSQDDPGAAAATPRVNFAWRKEGRIGKDMTCYLTGKSTDLSGKKAKKGGKEPDIAVALFSGLKEMTIMEPNLYRVEVEDYKGLEVVLVLSAAVLRDVFFGNTREAFHIIDPNSRKNSGGLRGRKASTPLPPSIVTPPVMAPLPLRQSPPPMQSQHPMQPQRPLQSQRPLQPASRTSLPYLQTGNQPTQRLDPRAQWDIDAESARLRAQVEVEAREQKEMSRRARRKVDEEEARKTQKFLEQEERQRRKEEQERRRKQAEVDKETERLRRQFGNQSQLLAPAHPPAQQRHSAPLTQGPFPQAQARIPAQAARPIQQGPYLQPPPGQGHQPTASQSSFFSNGLSRPDGQSKMKKKSFWGLRSVSESNTNTLRKKQSSMF
jgi:hypothetical protein